MFGSTSGTWWIKSESDPRWNCSGYSDCMAFTAGMPSEAKEELEILKKEYGEPPEDLQWGGMKD